MGYIIEITEDKVSGISENLEKALRYAGKAMQCVDDIMQDAYGERGGRYGERDDEEWDEDDDRMGERSYGRGRMYPREWGRGGYGERRGGRRRDSRGRYA